MRVMTIDTLRGLSGPDDVARDPLEAFQLAGDRLDAALQALMNASETRQLPPDSLEAYYQQSDAIYARWQAHMEAIGQYDAGGEARARWVITAESIAQDIDDYVYSVDQFLGGTSASFGKRFGLLTVGTVLLLGGLAAAAVYAGRNK